MNMYESFGIYGKERRFPASQDGAGAKIKTKKGQTTSSFLSLSNVKIDAPISGQKIVGFEKRKSS